MNCASTSIDARCWKWQDLQEVAYFNAEFAWEDTWFHHLWVSVKNSDCRPFLLITDLSHNHRGVKYIHSSLKFLIVSKKVLRLLSLLIANAHVRKTKEKQRCCNFHYHLPFWNLTASLLLAEFTRPTWGKKKSGRKYSYYVPDKFTAFRILSFLLASAAVGYVLFI